MEKVIVYGNGPVAKGTYFSLKNDSAFDVVAFTVDREFIDSNVLFDLPVIPYEDIQNFYPSSDHKMMIAVGYIKGNQVRAEKYSHAKSMGYQMISHISSLALIGPEVVIGENSVIGANCILSGFTKIGNDVRIGAGSYIGHDTIIEDHSFLSNHVVVGGSVKIESYCFIGLNATIRNKIVLGKHTYIGAGAVLLQDTKEKQVFIARPAELLPISSDELSLV